MTTLALVNPSSLLGNELKEALERSPGLWTELRLLAGDPEEAGALTELAGAAAMVGPCDREALAGVDLVLRCGEAPDAASLRGLLAPAATLLLVAPAAPPEDAPAIVAGVNLERAVRGGTLVSPHPAVAALALLLAPLAGFGLDEALAWILQPASMRGRAGLDELLEQTRSILAFRPRPPDAVFGHQLAFNLLPTPAASGPFLAELRQILGERPRLGLQIVQAGVFHSLAASLHLRFVDDPGAERLREALAGAPFLRLVERPESLGPIEAAGRDEVLLGALEADPGRPGAYWLWGVMDNLTRGGALNAVAVAEALLSPA